MTVIDITVSDIRTARTNPDDSLYWHEARVSGPKGETLVTGCAGISPSGRYRVYFNWKHMGSTLLGSSSIVEAPSAIEAAIKVAGKGQGGYVSCSAGTAESS